MSAFQEIGDFGDLLPTYKDVHNFFNFQRQKVMQEKQNKQEPGFQGIANAAANAILNLY